jgi:hypothetical protein
MYDEYLRSKCYLHEDYDRMIVLIMQHNLACTDIDWACNAINACIRRVVFSDNVDYSTGMCQAIRAKDYSAGADMKPRYVARLSLSPSFADTSVDRMAQIIRMTRGKDAINDV